MSDFVIDAFEFCRTNGRREGLTTVAEMPRLAAECADRSGELAWSLQGGSTKEGFPRIDMTVRGTVQLVCQRCLTPFAYTIDSSSVLMLGKDDADADEIEEVIDDESVDVIVGSRTCDIRDLIEDEALLALPQAPKHEACPDTSALDALRSEKVSPFEALKSLKK